MILDERVSLSFCDPGDNLYFDCRVNNKNVINQQGIQRDENVDDTWYSIFPVENEELVYGVWEEEVRFLIADWFSADLGIV